MNIQSEILKKADIVSLKLRQLYEQSGYVKYRMNQFEEYGFYLENKNFLGNGSYITFTDKGGRLMALKPDVTLSIVKNVKNDVKDSQRLYYVENIYRMIKKDGEYREISQTGLEFIGEIDIIKTVEVLMLAIKSLEIIDKSFVLTVSHMGIISGLMESFEADYTVKEKILDCIKRKSPHDAARVCEENGIDEETQKRIKGIIAAGGKLGGAAKALKEISCNDEMLGAAEELAMVAEFFENSEYKERVVLDFDTISDTQYYNGIMFCGYIEGVAASALVGGRYDNLLKKMGKENLQAMGFAINFYELDRFLKENGGNSVDTVILYDDKSAAFEVMKAVENRRNSGLKVIAEKALPENVKYETVIDLRGNKGEGAKDNA